MEINVKTSINLYNDFMKEVLTKKIDFDDHLSRFIETTPFQYDEWLNESFLMEKEKLEGFKDLNPDSYIYGTLFEVQDVLNSENPVVKKILEEESQESSNPIIYGFIIEAEETDYTLLGMFGEMSNAQVVFVTEKTSL